MTQLANILIYVAGLLWAIEGIPQVIKLLKTKETKGVSIIYFVLCVIAYTLFLIGNIILHNKSIIIASLCPYIIVSTILFLVVKYKGGPNGKSRS
jgi:MtN3 and saliva related transmembrane protein